MVLLDNFPLSSNLPSKYVSSQSVAQTLVCSGYKSLDLLKLEQIFYANLKVSVQNRLKSVLPVYSLGTYPISKNKSPPITQ